MSFRSRWTRHLGGETTALPFIPRCCFSSSHPFIAHSPPPLLSPNRCSRPARPELRRNKKIEEFSSAISFPSFWLCSPPPSLLPSPTAPELSHITASSRGQGKGPGRPRGSGRVRVMRDAGVSSAATTLGALATAQVIRGSARTHAHAIHKRRAAVVSPLHARSVISLRRSSRLTGFLTTQRAPEQKYLSYYDVTLTNEDVRALQNDWLTDNNITFWEEYLEREVLPKYPQARIALLRPSLSLLLMNENTEAARRQLPDFRNVTHIFIPITDVKDLSKPEGGTHWSLLLVSAIDGVAFHYDSLGSINLPEAREATSRLAILLGINFRFRNIEDTPQQENGNDCGVFVCVLMRFLLVKRLLNAHAREKVSMGLSGKMIDAHGGRKEMLKIIENLRREGERRRSTSPFVRKEVPRIE